MFSVCPVLHFTLALCLAIYQVGFEPTKLPLLGGFTEADSDGHAIEKSAYIKLLMFFNWNFS